MPILEVKNLKKIYTSRFGGNSVQALSNVSFSVEKGEYVAIMGESGSGKTTLLNILASLDKPSSGQVLLNGRNIVDIKEKEISAFRRDNLGFVFQEFNLLDTFTLEDNIFLMDQLTTILDEDGAETVIAQVFKGLAWHKTAESDMAYKCYCSRERVERALISLGRKELEEIRQEGKTFPVECQFCDAVYDFSAEDLKGLLKNM